MSKLILKFLVVSLILTGLCTVFSGGHAAAAALPNNCPANDTSLPSRAYDTSGHVVWGNDSDGEGSGVMSSVILRARDDSGNPLNPHFTINSALPGGGDQAQIYRWPIGSGGSVSNSDTWQEHGDFQFGTTMHNGNGNSVQCNGWVVMGPGTAGHVGNGWVLNCHSEGPLSQFWISHLDEPASPYGGRWEMLDANGGVVDSNVNSGSAAHFRFNAINGSNMRFTFVWHANAPPHNAPNLSSECTILDITDGGDATINGKNFSPNDIKTTVRVSDSSGQVLVHDASSQNNFLELNNERRVWQAPQYAPRGATLTVQVYRQYYHNTGNKDSNGNWIYQWDNIPVGSKDGNGSTYEFTNNQAGDQTRTHTCFSAGCGVYTVEGNVPGRTGDAVIAGTQYNVTMKVHNNGPLTLNNPTLGGAPVSNSPLNQYDEGYANFTFTAPNGGPQNYTVNLALDDVVPGLASCPVTVAVYQSFSLEPHANLTYASSEDPGTIGYETYVQNNASTAISAPTHSTFTVTPYGGGTRCSAVAAVDDDGPFNPGRNNTLGPGNCTPSSVSAGDQYCTRIAFTGGYNQGYVGPGGALAGTSLNANNASSEQCFTVTNKPYFKAYDGGVAAGGDFKQPDGSCSSGSGGLLAGWNSNTGGVDRGAGSELSALAMVKITGFASAQTNISRSPTALTYANTVPGDISTSSDSPKLGGNFNPGGSLCLTDAEPQSGTTAKPGGYVQPGKTGINDSESVFVDGDVYINGNVTYANSWSGTNRPSFVLRATGNIYIAPGVTELDGLYISKNKIYTCAVNNGGHFAAVGVANVYGTCKNQLLVYGNFVAKQLKLLRSFGSLRDEKPTGGSPAVAGSPAQDGLTSPLTISTTGGSGCTRIDEPRDANYRGPAYLCMSSADQTAGKVSLSWFNNGKSGSPSNCTDEWQDVLDDADYRDNDDWDKDYLCASVPITLSDRNISDQQCTRLVFPIQQTSGGGGHGGNNPGDPWPSNLYLCLPTAKAEVVGHAAVPPGAPAAPACSNKGTQVVTSTCAAEIFRFSPTLYLTDPAIEPPSKGATQYDSITSLPPVL